MKSINDFRGQAFLSYLWGMETLFHNISIKEIREPSSYPTYEEWKLILLLTNAGILLIWFLSYLWGMETGETFKNERGGRSMFLSYLWGMETINISFFILPYFIVLILPMRNGNLADLRSLNMDVKASFLSYLWGMETRTLSDTWMKKKLSVLILPMRNGNTPLIMFINSWFVFLSYLWGMETCFVTTVYLFLLFLSYLWGMETHQIISSFALHQDSVLILPMRNGNQILLRCLELKLFQFLSYLWGMETSPFPWVLENWWIRSYPTYEEWKQNYKEEEVKEMTSSYPTYEEWKPGITRSEE